jgi:hypothetical protein
MCFAPLPLAAASVVVALLSGHTGVSVCGKEVVQRLKTVRGGLRIALFERANVTKGAWQRATDVLRPIAKKAPFLV